MSDDSFTHDEASFEPGNERGGVAIEDGEARYADLVAEVIWGGTITPESRQRLETAREVFGLSSERAAQIEEAQIATQRVRIFEEPTQDDALEQLEDAVEEAAATRDEDLGEAPGEPRREVAGDPSRAPSAATPVDSQVAVIAPSDDPRIHALQRRIIVVEDENDELAFENRSLRDLVQQLENLVEQLQYALEETLDELHQVKGGDESGDHAAAPAASMVQAVTPPLAPLSEESLPDSGPAQSTEIPIRIEAPPEPPPQPRPEMPTLLGLGEVPVEPEPETQPRPHIPGAARKAAERHELTATESSSRSLSDEIGSEGASAAEESEPSVSNQARVPSGRRRFRSHEEIAEAIEPVFAGALPGVTRRPRKNPADLHAALSTRPRDPELLRALLQSLGRADDADRRWCVAQALVFLEASEDAERALYEAHADLGLVRPRRALDDAEWHGLLFHPDEELLTGQILAAIAPAVMLGQMTAIRASIAPELLHPEQQIDPHSSTLQSVRCLVWAAAILGLATPPIFVVPNHEGCIDMVLNPRPTTRLGKRALAGRRSRELAFEAGRHLSWWRKEHLLGRPTRSIRRLEDMFLAALMIGNPGLPISADVKARVEPISKTIRPLLDRSAVEELVRGFTRFVEEGGRTKLGRWLRGAERTAHRAGMLLANDLWAADAMLRMDDPDSAEAAVDELIVFLTSAAYHKLRRRLGIALPAADA